MALATQPPESDLILPLPGAGEQWDHHTIHTHYFGFAVPDAVGRSASSPTSATSRRSRSRRAAW